MAYQVLARQWRPRNFSEMVGQIHVLKALSHALENNRLHHAYLFTGTRGVGKTTIARILAKSLNCETRGVTATPCGQCHTCREIDEGRFIDLIEVDAASRTKVEDTRELLENVQYTPTRGRYKVYLIDEVHMLSDKSFNALLKTLEEPPPHVKFLLATTDPQKLPPTVRSRCLQFNLKRVPVELIIQQLSKILDSESIEYELPALQLLAHAADGSLRDALSLLDQAIAYTGAKLTSSEVNGMLGTLDQQSVLYLVNALAQNDSEQLLQHIAHLAEYNPDYPALLADILSLLQRIALIQFAPATVDTTQPDAEALLQLAQQLTPEDVQLFYQIGLLGRRDLPLAPDLRGGFEMVMLRMLVFRPVTLTPAVTTSVSTPKTQAVSPKPTVAMPSASKSMPIVSPTIEQQPLPSTNRIVPSETLSSPEDWTTIVQNLSLTGATKQLALNCSLNRREENTWYLNLTPGSTAYKSYRTNLEEALQKQLGHKVRVVLQEDSEHATQQTPAVQQQRQQETRLQEVKARVATDSFVVEMQTQFDAKIHKIDLN